MNNIYKIKSMKNDEKIAVLTCYDYSFARMVDSVVDIILVGDSLGMVVYGEDSTRNVTMNDMIRHVKAVKRGTEDCLIVADMPFKSFEIEGEAVTNARLLMDAGADAVKPENKPEIVRALVDAGISVMGHIGLTPQTVDEFKVQGKDKESANKLVKLAKEIEEAGAFSIVLECIPTELGGKISRMLKIPTIGIGAGKECDGQVLVIYDMLGLYDKISPKFVKKYAELKEDMEMAVKDYVIEVKEGKFPGEEHSYD